MALFNIDIERYYQSQLEDGFELKSIAYMQYPIYCIHATIIDSTPDPLEKLDKAIIKCLLINSEYSSNEISQLISVQKMAVEMRLRQMKLEGLIEGDNNLEVTDLGFEIIVHGKEKRRQRRQYNFYIDGIDFMPLSSDLYSPRYLKSFFDENEYTYYTNSKGNTIISKPFKPSIVHEPLIKEKVLHNILNISENKREAWSIPEGLEEIESIDFTKMSIPILVGLMVKDKKGFRKLLDGFSPTGDSDKIAGFNLKIKSKIDNLELRIDTWKDQKSEADKFAFASNWVEIDKKNEDQKLQFISKEDLKLALGKIYNIEFSSDEEIINTEFEIGINITKKLLLNLKSNRKQVLKNLERGRDYQMTSVKNGMWIIFITFKTNSSFVNYLLEIQSFLNDARKRDLKISHISKRLLKNDLYRNVLVLLEEYELLEKMDINQHMNKILNE
ncbi:hypothetical protein [Gelidibacter pelagius]|uniref:Uncharacterized protein n=1 Tax=Gelidibacter pelagius TaxID=2819985 RepID=A0ABS3SRC2_9FLAO|nr:hypothetical protein [Gelidibacter pelagius]MBO3097851.1 hypothetical protein [Gelidibacter pelagius]